MPIKKTLLLPINFTRPWWLVIWQQKWRVSVIIIGEATINVFDTISPILLGSVFTAKRYDYFAYFTLLWLASILLQDTVRKMNATLQLRCIHSIHFSSHQRLLVIDPLYHAHRDTGATIAKIERGARAYETFLDAVLVDILGYIAGIVAALVSLAYESAMLTYLLCLLLGLILIFNIILSKYFIVPREQELIEAEDTVKSSAQENLAQINLIRSYFATNEINESMAQRDTRLIYQEKSLWNANITMWSIIKIMYLITVFVLGTYILHHIHHGNLTAVEGIAFMIMYVQGTYGIISIERPIRQATKSLTRIKDLFQFIPAFGIQTFNVLPEAEESLAQIKKSGDILLSAQMISFSYGSLGNIFDNHNVQLAIPSNQQSKLYGIIGPSGMGKSTLLSILGGQLNPTTGTVTLNDINIYLIDDTLRRSLITMQGQVASSMRGTLRYNLLFGLPTSHIESHSDHYLITILNSVGLWEMFNAKKGLETLIGEGGLTLSGGQRQRLNFASLYLRAQAYQPLLILIDEPTSSLDEVSEQAITTMMEELAQKALTLVIAHRIKTLEKATGILDISLINEQKDLTFYTQQELLSISAYYQQLVKGTVTLDE